MFTVNNRFAKILARALARFLVFLAGILAGFFAFLAGVLEKSICKDLCWGFWGFFGLFVEVLGGF